MDDTYNNEKEYSEKIIAIIKKSLQQEYKNKPIERRFHPKSHGLLNAQLVIEKNLPLHLKQGLFAEEKTYPVHVRFTNANPSITNDSKKSVRGMALKVYLENDNTQDFLLTTNKILFPGTVKKYYQSIKGLFINKLCLIPIVLNPLHWKAMYYLFSASKKITDVLAQTYWSGTPYKLGDNQAIKIQIKPSSTNLAPPNQQKIGDNFLRTNLLKTLQQNDYFFDINIQIQEHIKKQPIEDSSVFWKSPFTKVATLIIEKQNFDTIDQCAKEKEIFFSLWNSIQEHLPLGGNNRLRQKIYSVLHEFRKRK